MGADVGTVFSMLGDREGICCRVDGDSDCIGDRVGVPIGERKGGFVG